MVTIKVSSAQTQGKSFPKLHRGLGMMLSPGGKAEQDRAAASCWRSYRQKASDALTPREQTPSLGMIQSAPASLPQHHRIS